MRNRYLFLLLAIGAIALLLLPFIRALIVVSASSVFRSFNEPLCDSVPEPPSRHDPPIPDESQRETALIPSETLVSQVARDVLGKEFIYAQAGEARPSSPRGEFDEGETWINLWVENARGLRIDEQREHWNPKIMEVSREVFQRDTTVDGLEFRMYFNENLTYWVRTSRKAEVSSDGFEYGWYRIRYSECREAF